jgi:hypothetical protein
MTTTPPILDEFMKELQKVRSKSIVLNLEKMICLASFDAYNDLLSIAGQMCVVEDYRYHYSPLRVYGISIIRADHIKDVRFTFAVIV